MDRSVEVHAHAVPPKQGLAILRVLVPHESAQRHVFACPCIYGQWGRVTRSLEVVWKEHVRQTAPTSKTCWSQLM